MIYLVTGLPGNGKSYLTVSEAPTRLAHPGRTIYHNGIPELKLPWELCDASTWYNLPDGSGVVIDEAQQIFRPLPTGAERPRNIRDLETHRHRGFDIWLITQHANLIDSHVRRLVGKHIHVHRPFGLQAFNVWEWEKVEDPEDYHAKKRAVTRRVPIRKEVYQLYKSAEIHTVKRQLPWKLFLIPLAIAAVAFGAWFAYSTLRGSTESKKSKVESSALPAGTATKSAALGQEPRIQKALERLQSMQPMIRGLPHTAPRYDELTRPVAVPVVRGCFSDLGVIPPLCWCVSQRGTRVDVSRPFCESVLREGRPFYDHEAEPSITHAVQISGPMPGQAEPTATPAAASKAPVPFLQTH